MHNFFRRLGIVVAAVLLPCATVPRALAADPAAVMVVVDGSGSMAGNLEGGGGKSKINLVREALGSALAQVGKRPRIGLASLGAGPRSCGLVDVLRPPGPVEVEPMLAQLDRIRPRGKGPLTLALRQAAEALPKVSGPRSVLLIHDGPDNCQPDLCTAASELSAIGIAVHVVSVGVEPEDLAAVACLPQTTGGRHFKARNAEELATVIGEALRLASNEMAVAGFTTTIVPPAPVPASGPAALYLRAVPAPDAQPLSVPLHWTVSAEGRSGAPVFEAWTANPVVPVEPGRYVVEVGNGLVSARETVVVHENRPAPLSLALGAGVLRVKTVAGRTSALLTDAIVTVTTGADAAPVAVFRAGEGAALLPAGRFTVRAELGLVRSEPRTLDLAAGQSATVDIPLDAGRLQLTAAARDGGAPPGGTLFIVTKDDPPRPRREVARSAAAQADFVLPPGTYYVVARLGGAEVHERLAVGSGDLVRRALTVPAGRLSLSATDAGGTRLVEDLVSYTIQRIDEPGHEAIETSRPAPVLYLSSGRYRVEGRYGLTNVKTVREVDIRAGADVQLPLEHQIATLRLRLAGGGAASRVSWEVRDRAGQTVWASDRPEAVAVLQAGRYLVGARLHDRREERTVELFAGDSELVEFRGG